MTGATGGDRLDSWKAIAAYLGRDMGTVRRWERTKGLPVHRVPGGKGSSVFAYTSEIDSWLTSGAADSADSGQAASEPPASEGSVRPAWWWAVAPVAIVAAIFITWQMQKPRALAVDLQVHLDEQALTARDGEGRELWSHRLDEK